MSDTWRDMPVVVTGGAGFIGSNLTRRLLEQGARVTVIDNLFAGKMENLAFVDEQGFSGRFRFEKLDIRDADAMHAAIAGARVVFHMAAMGSVPMSVDQPHAANDINVTGSLNVLLAARDAGARTVVSSSSAIYGDNPELPKHEGMRPEPASPYASSKIAMEYYAQNMRAMYGAETAILRYFNVFGPHQDPDSQYAAVIPIFVSRLLRGERPVIFGDGEQTRDFVHVNDVVRANMLAALAPESALATPMNVAGGKRISVNLLFNEIARLLKSELTPQYTDARAGDVLHSVAAVDKAAELLGFRAETDVKDGLAQSIDWYKNNLG